MAHVFVAPHPDDVALSCGGLIASLRELGQNVTILTVFSGSGSSNGAVADAATSARRSGSARRPSGPPPRRSIGRPSAPTSPPTAGRRRVARRGGPARGHPGGRGRVREAVLAARVVVPPREHPHEVARRAGRHRRRLDPGPALQRRRRSTPRRPATSSPGAGSRTSATPTSPRHRSCSSTCPTRSSAATRATTSCSVRSARDDDAPVGILRTEIARLEPQTVYLPLGVGNHVDHQLCRDAGVALLAERRRWVMPGPEWAGQGRLLRGLPVRLVEPVQLRSTTCPRARSTASPRAST